jgi:hypothetical protein
MKASTSSSDGRRLGLGGGGHLEFGLEGRDEGVDLLLRHRSVGHYGKQGADRCGFALRHHPAP